MSARATSAVVAWRDPGDVIGPAAQGELTLVDVRSPTLFASGHPQGAINVAYSPKRLAERVAAVVPDASPVAVLGADESEAADAARQLLASSRPVAGLITVEPSAWIEAGAAWETLAELSVERLTDDRAGLAVVDVREPVEWDTGHVPGAILLPLGALRDHLDELPRDRTLAVICESGLRSSTGASFLKASGFPAVVNVPDGTAAFRSRGLPLVSPGEVGR